MDDDMLDLNNAKIEPLHENHTDGSVLKVKTSLNRCILRIFSRFAKYHTPTNFVADLICTFDRIKYEVDDPSRLMIKE